MDFPTELPVGASLKPGQNLEVPVTAQFNQEALQIEENLPIQAQFTLKWESGGQTQSVQKNIAATLYRRTALTWDNSGKLASFMTPNEETVNAFALRCMDQAKGMAPEERALGTFSQKVWRAAIIADSLGAYGINYLEDPDSPLSKALGKSEMIDTVRFPRTTLYFKNGDCDDNSALLASLYESAGISTAIMTSPGHVFIAFDTGDSADNAWIYGGTASGAAMVRNKTVWLPIESTDVKNGFLHAWQSAARLVAQYQGSKDLEMLPVHEQWSDFPSIPLPASPYQLVLPPAREQKTLVMNDAGALGGILYDQALKLAQAQLPAQGKQRISQLNRMGILHARFGNNERAVTVFQQAMKEDARHLAAYLNLGSLYLQSGKLSDALGIFLQAKAVRPESPAVQLMLAQTYFALGDQPKTQEAFLALSQESRDLADQYSWLSRGGAGTGAVRAAEAGSLVKPLWSDAEK
jgi:tetratricopeptide (TPR) repeat protein